MLITDEELADRIYEAVKEYNRDRITAGILIRDIRFALRRYDSQGSVVVEQVSL